jgi:hypothetical protein
MTIHEQILTYCFKRNQPLDAVLSDKKIEPFLHIYQDRLFPQGFGTNYISQDEYKAEFYRCARLTIRLYNFPTNPNCSESNLKQALDALLRADGFTNVDKIRIFCFKKKGTESKPYVLASMTIIVPGDDEASIRTLLHILENILACSRLVLEGKVINAMTWPYTPSQGAVDCACSIRISANMNSTLRGANTVYASSISQRIEPSITTITTDDRALPPPPNLTISYDPIVDIPESFGDLPHGLNSPVISIHRLQPSNRTMETYFKTLVETLRKQTHPKYNVTPGRGVTVWSREEAFILNHSSLPLYFGAFTRNPASSSLEDGSWVWVALKFCSKSMFKEGEMPWFLSNYVDILNNTNPGIAKYFDVFEHEQDIVIVQEVGAVTLEQYCRSSVRVGRSLRLLTTTSDAQELTKERERIIRALCLAVSQLHNKLHICHNDLNLSNVFISFDGKLKVADFGMKNNSNNNNSTTAEKISIGKGDIIIIPCRL